MSIIFVNAESKAQAKKRVDQLGIVPELRTPDTAPPLEWLSANNKKEINYTPLPSVNNYEDVNIFTNNQRFVNNAAKLQVLENSIHYIHPITYWFRCETLINLGAMQLIRIVSGIKDLDYLNHLLLNNQGIYQYMKDPMRIQYWVYRYSLTIKTPIPEKLQRSIYYALIENVMLYSNNEEPAEEEDSVNFYPELSMNFMEKLGFYYQAGPSNNSTYAPTMGIVARKKRQEVNPISCHFHCALCLERQDVVKDNSRHVHKDHRTSELTCNAKSACGYIIYDNYNDFLLHRLTFCRSIADKSPCLYCELVQDSCTCSKNFVLLLKRIQRIGTNQTFVNIKETNLVPVFVQYLWQSQDKTEKIPEGTSVQLPDGSPEIDLNEELANISLSSMDDRDGRSIKFNDESDTTLQVIELKMLIQDQLNSTDQYLSNIEFFAQTQNQVNVCIFSGESCEHSHSYKDRDHYRNAHFICPQAKRADNNEPPVLRTGVELLEHFYKYHLATTIGINEILYCSPENDQYCKDGFTVNKYESAAVLIIFLKHFYKEHEQDATAKKKCKQCPSWVYMNRMGRLLHYFSWHEMSGEEYLKHFHIKKVFKDDSPYEVESHEYGRRPYSEDLRESKKGATLSIVQLADEHEGEWVDSDEDDDGTGLLATVFQTALAGPKTLKARKLSFSDALSRRNSDAIDELPAILEQSQDEGQGVFSEDTTVLHNVNRNYFAMKSSTEGVNSRSNITATTMLSSTRPGIRESTPVQATSKNNRISFKDGASQNRVASGTDEEGHIKCRNETHKTPPTFANQESKDLHILDEHKCPLYRICGFSDEFQVNIWKHYNAVHEIQRKTCEVCNEKVDDLVSHYRLNHFQCPSCQHWFLAELDRDEHLSNCSRFQVPKLTEPKPMLVGADQMSFKADLELELVNRQSLDFNRRMIDKSNLSEEEKRMGKSLLERQQVVEQLKRAKNRANLLQNNRTIKTLMFVLPVFSKETKDISKSTALLLAGIEQKYILEGNCAITPEKALKNYYKIDHFTRKIKYFSQNMPLNQPQCKTLLQHYLSAGVVANIEGLSQSDYSNLTYEYIINTLQRIYCPLFVENLEQDVLQAKKEPGEDLLGFQNRIRRILDICAQKLSDEQERANYKEYHLRHLTMENLPDDLKKEVKQNEEQYSVYTSAELATAHIIFSQKRNEKVGKNQARDEEVFNVENEKGKRAKAKNFFEPNHLSNPSVRKESRNKGKFERRRNRSESPRSRAAPRKVDRKKSQPSRRRSGSRPRSRTRSRSRSKSGARFKNGKPGTPKPRRRRSRSFEAKEVRNHNQSSNNNNNNNNNRNNNNNNNGGGYNRYNNSNQGNNGNRKPFMDRNTARKQEFETKKKRLGEPWASRPKFCLRCMDLNHWQDSPECKYDHTVPVADHICWKRVNNQKYPCGYHAICKSKDSTAMPVPWMQSKS